MRQDNIAAGKLEPLQITEQPFYKITIDLSSAKEVPLAAVRWDNPSQMSHSKVNIICFSCVAISRAKSDPANDVMFSEFDNQSWKPWM